MNPERISALLRSAADERGLDVQRLRRHLVFQRVLARLANDDRWVLKGGFALEVRLAGAARATVDLDLALLSTADDVRELLLEQLSDGDDGFTFHVARTKPLPGGAGDGSDWRFTVRCTFQGREVATVRIDVVERPGELEGGVGQLSVPAPAAALGFASVEVQAVNIAQHAAEKVHAIERTYANDLPSSRVKDLLDLVLMIETGLLPDPRWGERLVAVYRVRDGRPPPASLPTVPGTWHREYPPLAQEVGSPTLSLPAAVDLVSSAYTDAVAHTTTEDR